MKKQLLLGTALATVMAANAQNQKAKPVGAVKAPRVNELAYSAEEPGNGISSLQNQAPTLLADKAASSGTTPVTWIPFANSINVFGCLVPNSRIINYNEDLNVVSFIHRKFCTYTITNTSEDNSGVMVARIIRNWNPAAINATFTPQFDSTAFGSNSTNFPRYQNGGLYNPPGNTNINNAYIVGCGPTTNGSGWTGNWYSSKQLGSANFNNITGTGASQQWFANTPTTLLGHNFNRYSFSYTDDGLVRSVATVGTPDATGSGGPTPGDTALYITTGTFAGGTFSWTGTQLYPDFQRDGAGDCNFADVIMAWNESGTVGYAIAIGQNKTTTVTVNRGLQPRVWKTTNSGASWAAIPNMDFTSPTMSMVVNDLPAALAANTTVAVPWFRSGEGMDAVVDKDDRLHFATTVISHSSVHPDSVNFIWSFVNGGDRYWFPHVPGARPYIYDFTTTGSSWSVAKIDSMSTEAPRATAASQGTGNGYDENPWLPGTSPVSKPVSSGRIQLGRTPNGSHIYYTWAESDTLITNGNKKWNTFPNIKVRVLDVTTGSLSPEFNATSPTGSVGLNTRVRNYAHFHYASPKSAPMITGPANTWTLAIPMSVSNNQSLNGNGDCTSQAAITHFFNGVTVTHAGIIYNNVVGINENSQNLKNMQVIPNPTSNNTNIVFDMLTDAKVLVNVTDVTGKIVRSLTSNTTLGQNTININVNDLKAGIYFVSLTANNQKATAKLIVE